VLLALAAPLVLSTFFRWLKIKLGNEKYATLMNNIRVGINAMEARMGAGGGADKKKAVELLIVNKLKWANRKEVSLIIDAIVEEINREVKVKSVEQVVKVSED